MPVRATPNGLALEAGAKTPLFTPRLGFLTTLNGLQYSVSSDGQRFPVSTAIEEGPALPIGVILNWKPKDQ